METLDRAVAGRVPPHSLEAEVAVLGAILLEQEALPRALELLGADCFYKSAHRTIFQAAIQLFERREPVDIVTLTNELRKMDRLEAVGGTVALSTLLDSVATAANIEYHARIVHDKYLSRRLISASKDIITEGYADRQPTGELLDQAQSSIFSISEGRLRDGFVHIKEVVRESFLEIENLHHNPDAISGIRTSFDDLDAFLAGLHNGDLIILAARPSMGKTSLALSLVQNVAIDHKHPVAIFSLEMSKQQLALRMLCSEARVDNHRLRRGIIQKHEWPNLTKAASLLTTAPIFIDDTPGMNVLEMRAKARRLKMEKGLQLIVVDYLQLMQSATRAENRQQEISTISRSLKALSKELDVPVLAISQLSRAVESRAGSRRPMLSDLRESGAIEQDADVVLFLYREEVYDRDCPEDLKGVAEVIIGKQRNGPIGEVKLKFFAEYTRFENLARGIS
ncbi:MAG: replicative DNA helicase [Candidatus Latescibacterota bacterium]|nr:MAG: replicative DNA helicase [Candidatus Latescibacterota bacterium]